MTDSNYELACFCALNRIFGFEPTIARRLVEHYGSAGALFGMSDEEKLKLLGPFSKYAGQINGGNLEAAAKELEWLRSEGYVFLSIEDENYPSLLKECDDAPMGLYVRASSPPEEVFNCDPCVAVVGTRDLSLYGKEWCRRIVTALATAQRKPVIVSGLALGVDINAHLTALENGLKTIAVMATGIEGVYPSRHREFAARIAATGACALITDYPPGTSPVAINFMRRNRIIAGISGATVLVESREKGGGMITANLAQSYNRDVFALPGRIDDPRSQGCNRLIRGKVAEPITDLDEFVDSIGLGIYNRRTRRSLDEELLDRYGGKMGVKELNDLRRIAGLIKKYRGANIEELCEGSGLRFNEVAALAGILENDGIIDIDLLQRCTINVKKA